MMKVLLTGAGGFVGNEVLGALLRRGYDVHAIGRENSPRFNDAHVTWHTTNLLNREAVRAVLEAVKPQGLIHLAWDTRHGHYWETPFNLDWLAASLFLIRDFSSCGGKRVVIAGSSAEYQWGSPNLLDEFYSPIAPASLYGISKNALREIVATSAPTLGISWAWGRFFNIFGSGESPARLVPRVILTLQNNEDLFFDSGCCVRDFLCVSDAGDALAELFRSGVDGPVNIASGEGRTVREVIGKLANYINMSHHVHFDAVADKIGEPTHIVACTERLRNEVGWQPRAKLDDRLQQTCEWWQRV